MNKKQMVALWVGGILVAFILIYYGSDVSTIQFIDPAIAVNIGCLVGALLCGGGVAIITFLFVYTLRSKKKNEKSQ